jgi:uncharacterized membrane protein YozB (DUF420 family)
MSMQGTARTPGGRGLTIVMLAIAAALALWFIFTAAFHYITYTQEAYGTLWTRRFALIPHILGGVVAITTGLVQVWLGVTGRTRRLHIWLGRVYLGAVGIGSLAGFYLAATAGSGLAYGSGLFFLSTAWAVTTIMAYVAVRRRAIEQHREWMLRSIVVTFAFVFFRALDSGLESYGVAPLDAVGTAAWACWAVPLLTLEPILQYRKMRRR